MGGIMGSCKFNVFLVAVATAAGRYRKFLIRLGLCRVGGTGLEPVTSTV